MSRNDEEKESRKSFTRAISPAPVDPYDYRIFIDSIDAAMVKPTEENLKKYSSIINNLLICDSIFYGRSKEHGFSTQDLEKLIAVKRAIDHIREKLQNELNDVNNFNVFNFNKQYVCDRNLHLKIHLFTYMAEIGDNMRKNPDFNEEDVLKEVRKSFDNNEIQIISTLKEECEMVALLLSSLSIKDVITCNPFIKMYLDNVVGPIYKVSISLFPFNIEVQDKMDVDEDSLKK